MEINLIKHLATTIYNQISNNWNGKSVSRLPAKLLSNPSKPFLMGAAFLIALTVPIFLYLKNYLDPNKHKTLTPTREPEKSEPTTDSTALDLRTPPDLNDTTSLNDGADQITIPTLLKSAELDKIRELNRINLLAAENKPLFCYDEKGELQFLPEVAKTQEIPTIYKQFPLIKKALYQFVDETKSPKTFYFSFFCKHKDKEGLDYMREHLTFSSEKPIETAITNRDTDTLKFIFSELKELNCHNFPKGFMESAIKKRDKETLEYFYQFKSEASLIKDDFINALFHSHDKNTLEFIFQFEEIAKYEPSSYRTHKLFSLHDTKTLQFISDFLTPKESTIPYKFTDLHLPYQFIESAFTDRKLTVIPLICQFVDLENSKIMQKYVETLIRSENTETLEFICNSVPLKNILPTELFAEFQYFKDSQKQNLMIKFGYSPSKSQKLIIQDELAKKMEEQFPVLKGYSKFLDHSLGNDHKEIYGTNNAHKKFLEGAHESVLVALSDILEFRKIHGGDPNFEKNRITFKKFLKVLAARRYSIAKSCGTNNFEMFGTEKAGFIRPLYTHLMNGIYNEYATRLDHKKGVTLKIGLKTYILTQYVDKVLSHSYINFWEKNDPVFLHLEDQFQKIVCNNYINVQDLQKDIAYFHWLFANIVPFNRGSASIGEMITDALWLSHGYIPQKIEQGKSLDLEALTSPEFESFAEIYPAGKLPA